MAVHFKKSYVPRAKYTIYVACIYDTLKLKQKNIVTNMKFKFSLKNKMSQSLKIERQSVAVDWMVSILQNCINFACLGKFFINKHAKSHI